MNIEPLEPRIAPAAVVNPLDAKIATYTDLDGDKVTIKVSTGTLIGSLFTSQMKGAGEQLLLIDLSGGGFDDANLTISVVKVPGGDGLAHVGAIDSSGHDLGNVIVPGDLGRIDAGDATTADGGLKSLTARSMGRYGLANQVLSGDLESDIMGGLGALKVAGDIKDASIVVTGGATPIDGTIGSVTIGGSLIGGADGNSGRIQSTGAIGPVRIGGDVIGGNGSASALIFSGSTLGVVTVGGSIIGGSGASSGGIFSNASTGLVKIGGNVQGGSGEFSGRINSDGDLPFGVIIGGSLLGGAGGESGIVQGFGDIGPVKIAHNVAGGAGAESATIVAEGKLGAVTIGGSLIGGEGALSGRVFSGGVLGAVKIGHDVKGGGGNESGKIHTSGKLAGVTIGGSLLGGSGDQNTFMDAGGFLHEGQVFALGAIGPVKIGHNVQGDAGDWSGAVNGRGGMGKVNIGGSVVGGSAFNSGAIDSKGNAGLITIAHDLRGGSAQDAGEIEIDGSVPGITIGGSLLGGSANRAGRITSEGGVFAFVKIGGDLVGGSGSGGGSGTVDSARAVTIGGSLIGGSAGVSGTIRSGAAPIDSVRIGHDLIGGSNNGATFIAETGSIYSSGRIGSVMIGGSIIAGINSATGGLVQSGAIQAEQDIGSITVKGGLIGNAANGGITHVLITARGQAAPGTTTDVAIGKISVGGRVERAQIFAGYDGELGPQNADAQIGSVTVGGDWIASSIVAGAVNLGADDAAGGTGADADNVNFGNDHDFKIAEAGEAAFFSTIGSITIAGQVFGTTSKLLATSDDNFGFVAEEIGALKIGARAIALDAGSGNDGAPLGFFTEAIAFDLAAHEPGESIAFSLPALIPPATLVNASTVAYTDSDGDRVTVKLSKPLLTAGNVNMVFKFDNGTVDGANAFPQQLQLIDLAPLATNGIGVTVTVKRIDGDGLAQIGMIQANNFDLGKISIAGDLGGVRGGEGTDTPGVTSIFARSMGRLGLDTQPDPSLGFQPLLGGSITGNLGSLTIARDFTAGRLAMTGGGIGAVTIGGSLVASFGTGAISGKTIGAVKIGEHVQGGDVTNVTSISAGQTIDSVTIGGSFIGGTANFSGAIAAFNIGPVKIGHNLVGGTGGDSGIISPDIRVGPVAIGGSIVGGLGGGSARIAGGAIDPVKIGKNLLGGPADRSGRIEGSSIGAVTIGGSIVGGAGTFSGSLKSHGGDIGALKIAHDVHGGADDKAGGIDSGAKILSVSIGGSLIGAAGEHAFDDGTIFREGQIFAEGNIGAVKIGHDVIGGAGYGAGQLRSLANVASIGVGGSLVGNTGAAGGHVVSEGDTGAVRIGHDILGGAAGFTGWVESQGKLTSVMVGGSLIGGTSFTTGEITSDGDLGPVKIGHDVIGGSDSGSGLVKSGAKVTAVTIGGSLIGGSGFSSGVIQSDGDILAVKIGRDLIGGGISGTAPNLTGSGVIEAAHRIAGVSIGGSIISGIDDSTGGVLIKNASIRAGDDLVSLSVKGSLIGNVAPNGESRVVISARGHAVPVGNTNVAIGKVSIGGRVEWANILAGYSTALVATTDGVQIGSVKVGRDWIASNLVSGVTNLGADDNPGGTGANADNVNFGDSHDTFIGGLGSIFNRIASIVIKGTVVGTAAGGDHFGFTSLHIGAFKSLNFTPLLAPGAENDIIPLSPITDDVKIREV